MSLPRPASAGSSPASGPVARGSGGAAATPEMHATDAAIQILSAGGSAVDAAIGAAAVLGATRPFWCGIGGGGFMLAYEAATERVSIYEHREAAPSAIEQALAGRSIPGPDLCIGPLFAGVPGVPSGWELAHGAHGRLPIADIFEPAIEVCEAGFNADAVFVRAMHENAARLSAFTSTRALYFTGGEPAAIGTRLKNSDLARTYYTFARSGAQGFYRGAIADAIVKSAASPPVESGSTVAVDAGVISAADLSAYQAVKRDPITSVYRGHALYGAPPPSSGGCTVASILQMLDAFPLASMPRAQALHHFIEASKLAFADRNAYLADPAFSPVPVATLLSSDYAATRRRSIHSGRASQPPAAGLGQGGAHSTAHLTVSDRDGNVVAYTFTIGSIGGCGMVVPGTGFILNSDLTDFTFLPGHPNAPQAGKRPRSSMSPTLVLADGGPILALGSPGGPMIIPAVAHTLIHVLDFGTPLPLAVAAPRLLPSHDAEVSAEAAFMASPAAVELERLGHKFTEARYAGQVEAIAFDGNGGVTAVADSAPRGAGTARAEFPGARS